MITRRTSKEYFLSNIQAPFKVKYGTLNKKKPDVLYIRSKAKLKGILNEKDYKDDLTQISFLFQKFIKEILNKNKYIQKYISTFETPDKGVVCNKKSYLKYDIYFYPHTTKDMYFYQPIISNIVEEVNNKLKELCDNFHLELS